MQRGQSVNLSICQSGSLYLSPNIIYIPPSVPLSISVVIPLPLVLSLYPSRNVKFLCVHLFICLYICISISPSDNMSYAGVYTPALRSSQSQLPRTHCAVLAHRMPADAQPTRSSGTRPIKWPTQQTTTSNCWVIHPVVRVSLSLSGRACLSACLYYCMSVCVSRSSLRLLFVCLLVCVVRPSVRPSACPSVGSHVLV